MSDAIVDPATLSPEDLFVLAARRYAQVIHDDNVRKGFWDQDRNDGEALMLVVSELAEGMEYLRKGNGPSDHIPEFSGIEEECADAVIRLMDFCGGRGFRLAEAIVAKVEYNRSRPHRHGKQF